MNRPGRQSLARLFQGQPNDPEQWKRNQLALAVAVYVWFAGTGFVIPFLALYVRQLGGFNVEETAFWAGIALALSPLVSATVSPVWGILADRVGRKIMLQRSLFGFTIALGLMAFVTANWQLLAIRAGMGLFGGFVVTAFALVSVSNPPDRIGEGIGAIQSSRVLGSATGPLLGGLLADALGIRNSFFLSVGLGAIALGLVTLFVKESAPAATRPAPGASSLPSRRAIFTAPAFLGVLAAIVVVRLSERSFDPVLPLLVARLGASPLGIATTTGIIVSGGLAATSLTAALIGRLTQGRPVRPVLLLSLLAGAIAFVPLALAQTWWQLLLLRVAVGLVLGAAITLGFSAGVEVTPVERRGLGIGVLGSGSGYGASLGALFAGVVSAIGLELVFVVDAALFAVVFALAALAFRRAEHRPAAMAGSAGP